MIGKSNFNKERIMFRSSKCLPMDAKLVYIKPKEEIGPGLTWLNLCKS